MPDEISFERYAKAKANGFYKSHAANKGLNPYTNPFSFSTPSLDLLDRLHCGRRKIGRRFCSSSVTKSGSDGGSGAPRGREHKSRAHLLFCFSVFIFFFFIPLFPLTLCSSPPLLCGADAVLARSVEHSFVPRFMCLVRAQSGSSPDSRADFQRRCLLLLLLSLCAPQTIATC